MTLPLYASLEKQDRSLIQASGDLYASSWDSFWKITWPLSLPGVVSGTLLTFIPAAGDYVNATFLGSMRESMAGNVIDAMFLRVRDYNHAEALSISLMAALVYMFIPIFVVILYSFNKPEGAFNYTWTAFSLDAWLHPCADPSLCAAVGLSLKIAVLATLAATVVGTLAAFGLDRHNFRGKGVANILIFVPMATPEVVAGSSLLVLFVNSGFPLGQWTIWIAHTVFCLSFVVVTVKARLVGMDPGSSRSPRISTPTGCKPSSGSPCR